MTKFDRTRNIIFLDLDGVLADFDKFVYDTSGKRPWQFKSNSELWGHIQSIDHFYQRLDLTPYAKKLWTLAHHYGKVEVLTAIPRRTTMPEAETDKKIWVKKHFNAVTPVKIGPYSKDKWKHASPGDILIDDNYDNIHQWINAGGIGIHHEGIFEHTKYQFLSAVT